jgi:hypothetical protein
MALKKPKKPKLPKKPKKNANIEVVTRYKDNVADRIKKYNEKMKAFNAQESKRKALNKQVENIKKNATKAIERID